MKKNGFAFAMAALALLAFSISAAFGWKSGDPGKFSKAAWAFKAHNLEQLASYADRIVLVRAGETFPSEARLSDNGEDALPFEAVKFEILEAIEGPADETVFVERVGGIMQGHAAIVNDADGGPYKSGAVYLLFLRSEGTFPYLVNDQSRYLVKGNVLRADAAEPKEDPVAKALDGKTLEEARAMIAATLGKK